MKFGYCILRLLMFADINVQINSRGHPVDKHNGHLTFPVNTKPLHGICEIRLHHERFIQVSSLKSCRAIKDYSDLTRLLGVINPMERAIPGWLTIELLHRSWLLLSIVGFSASPLAIISFIKTT